MKLFAISDLHLAFGIDKPMDIFGKRWTNYMEKIEENWSKKVSPEDMVLIPGDLSWATYMEQAYKDFAFVESLPGTKVISKGNHDYWWTTANKMDKYFAANGFSSIRILHNNSITVGDVSVCGTRGWKCPGDDSFDAEDRKIYQRELQRLELSLKAAKESTERKLAVLHFPPFNAKREASEFVGLMQSYQVQTCIYGHLHGEAFNHAAEGLIDGIEYRLVSADYLTFEPSLLYEVK